MNKNKRWARKYDKCINCNRIDSKHKGNGLCINCYDSNRKKNPKSRLVQEKTRNKYRKEIRERQRIWYKELKQEVFNVLGNKCVRCGFDDKRALQIDHVNGGGYQEIKNLSARQRYNNVLKSMKKNEKKYQLLCANCNWIKRCEDKEKREMGGAPRKHK